MFVFMKRLFFLAASGKYTGRQEEEQLDVGVRCVAHD